MLVAPTWGLAMCPEVQAIEVTGCPGRTPGWGQEWPTTMKALSRGPQSGGGEHPIPMPTATSVRSAGLYGAYHVWKADVGKTLDEGLA